MTDTDPQKKGNVKGESLDAFWMPFTSNRHFKQNPLFISGGHGAYYTTPEGKQVFDGLSGLWCCGLGHGRTEIVDAVSRQMAQLDYSPAFHVGSTIAFELADRLRQIAPEDLNHVFFTNSGSDSADTSLKMARAYWRVKGQPGKTKLIGRARGYHGVNLGGTSVGGIGGNRKLFGSGLDTDHLPHTLLKENAFSRGLPENGVELADELEELVALHDASNIAAVIVEPFSGSGGVIVPPKGYLKRLRELCDKHGILLIFDEVITGFGRTGQAFAAQTFDTTPDIINLAKGLTNGTLPMGAVIAKSQIYAAFMEQELPEEAVEFPHGYTYSAHPVACSVALATLDLYETDQTYARVRQLAPYFEDAIHQLKGLPHITDIRNVGLAGALQFAARGANPTIRPYEIFRKCFEAGVYVRCGGNTIQIAPPFISEKEELDNLFNILSDVIQATA
ncbi:MAG: aspartate aminotransferase family protein [Fuerstiella sp.]|nr:aspartate aminotransferase family protein [Fuerstiella sp.]MCP4855001.1 aspartate aminotransferase family protein [Fuerstiella sp.]